MHRAFLLLATTGTGAAFAIAFSFVFSCGNGQAPPPDDDAGDAGDAAVANYVFAPVGCPYTVTVPSIRGFVNIAVDDTSAPTGDITPARPRIGLGGQTDSTAASYADPRTTAAFTWETPTQSNAAKVMIGTSPTALTELHTGYAWTTPVPTIGLHSANPKYMHEVHVCGLTAGTTYYYQVGGGPTNAEVWSATQSFTTVPDNTGTIMVGMLGDARDTVTTWQLVGERMAAASPAIELIPGDIVDVGTEEDLWTQWLNAIWTNPGDAGGFVTLGQQMIVPIAGNHENEASQFYGNWAIPGDGDYAETYASFDVGNTHFVMVDDYFVANALTEIATAQLAWLESDLSHANANRASVPFIAVLSHRGLFSTSLHAQDPDVLLSRGTFAPIYDKYAVDIVFNGHDHEYERSKPVMAGNPPSGAPVVGTGTTYVICAGAGADPYATGTSQAPYSQIQQAFGNGTPYLGTYGFLALTGNTMTFTAYGLKASGTDDVIDTLTLTH